MAIEVFPAPAAASSTPDAMTCTVGTLYEKIQTFTPAIYTVTCSSAVVAVVEFYSDSFTVITTATTVSGTVAVNLASTADRIKIYVKSGTSIPVTITKSANSLTNSFSGTLDTITSTGTYTGTSTSGYGYVVVVGAGGGGANTGANKGGGGSGGVGVKIAALTGSMAVTIGAAGVANTDGGATTFAGITAGGGLKGTGGVYGGDGGLVTGTYTYSSQGGNGCWSNQNNAGATTLLYPFVVNGTTGGGGGQVGYSGAGSGIGTGASTGTAAIGYGAGGAGDTNNDGRPGVVYILRF